MRDIFYLTRQILRYRLERRPDAGEEAALGQSFLKYGSIYVVASPDTSKQEWEARSFGVAIEDSTLRLFLEKEDAVQYACKINAVLFDGTPMVIKASQAMVKSLIADYSWKGFITKVWLCGKSPIRARVGIESFIKDIKRESPSTIMESDATVAPPPTSEPYVPAEPQTEVEITAPENLLLVDEVRKVLSEPAAAERKGVDPSGSYLNFHQLMDKLIHTNKIEPASLDQMFGLPAGFTDNLMQDVTACNVPKKIVGQYLKYFGLYEFLYLFKGQSTELAEELKKNPQIDAYGVKRADIHTKERFTLRGISHGKTADGANIYQLRFVSELREFKMACSSKLDKLPGKEYEIIGLEPLPDDGGSTNLSGKNAASSAASVLPSEEEMVAKLKEMEQASGVAKRRGTGRPSQSMPPQRKPPEDPRMTGKTRYQSETPEEKMEKDTQTVLQWIIKTKSIGQKEARRLMVKFDDDPEVMACFAAYVSGDKNADNKLLRRGYSPRRLMRQLHYAPLDAFSIMADLQKKANETLQMLKYRETDPQYQPKPKESKE